MLTFKLTSMSIRLCHTVLIAQESHPVMQVGWWQLSFTQSQVICGCSKLGIVSQHLSISYPASRLPLSYAKVDFVQS